VELADFLDFFLFGTLFVLVSLGAICYATPIFVAAVLPVLYVHFRTLNYFREASRETEQLDSISRSPVYSQFSETLGGLSTIRAYSQTAQFITDFLSRALQNTRASYKNKTAADRWLSVRLELVVLKGLSIAIKGGERVGIVGQTGSGKSLCLLQIVEPELASDDASQYQAPISIDGVDVLRIGLDDLRTKLGIIPQNPVLLSGTVRLNMDTFDEYTDEEIWLALDRCGMKSAVEEMPGELAGQVAKYGKNLSQGQRQLLCLGRALLKQCRILLLDEATSSMDFEMDREIQKTLRTSFACCTVLTIAHIINTIMDSDKILVMKDGKASEFAPPQELLKNEDSSLFGDCEALFQG